MRPTESGPSRQTLAQYGNQLVLRFNITSEEQAASLSEASDILFLDIWGSGANWVDLRVAKDVVCIQIFPVLCNPDANTSSRKLPSLLGLLPPSLQHAHKPLMQGNELARAVAATYPFSSAFPDSALGSKRAFSPNIQKHGFSSSNIFFNDYQPLGVISHWMDLLHSLFPTHVRVISVGSSHEGRNIKALRVGVHPTNDQDPSEPRKTIVITGGQHAREWISVSTVNYVAYSIITQYGKDPSITSLLEDVDILFVPTLNPDGYQYSFDHDRLWRKNRQPTTLQFCPGVDLDRCWNFKWDGQRTIDNPCSESFAGHSPFAAVEVRSFSEWIREETESGKSMFIGLLDLHSYSQEVLYPYSFSCHESPPTLEDLEEMGQGIAKAIRGSGRENYKVMSACEGNVATNGKISPKSEGGGGSALDWFYHEIGVRKAFQIKLRDQGIYGFLLPKEYIIPTGLEILSAVTWFSEQLAGLYTTRNTAADVAPPEEFLAANDL